MTADAKTGATVTLGSINKTLDSIGLPKVSSEQLKKMAEMETRERFLTALNRANNKDMGALEWLRILFERVGVKQLQGASPNAGGGDGDNRGAEAQPNSQAPRVEPEMKGNRGMSPSAASTSGESGAGQEFVSRHVYGGKGSLCFNNSITRSGKCHTISLDGATVTGPKAYNWSEKISVQITEQELPMVTALFLGYRSKVEYGNHGEANNKGFSFERQEGGKIFAKLWAKDKGQRAVPIMSSDAFWVGSMLYEQLKKNMPGMADTAILAMLRATCGD